MEKENQELEGEIVKIAKIDYHTAEITVRVNIKERPHSLDLEGRSLAQIAELNDIHEKEIAKWHKLQKALREMGLRKVMIVSIENTTE